EALRRLLSFAPKAAQEGPLADVLAQTRTENRSGDFYPIEETITGDQLDLLLETVQTERTTFLVAENSMTYLRVMEKIAEKGILNPQLYVLSGGRETDPVDSRQAHSEIGRGSAIPLISGKHLMLGGALRIVGQDTAALRAWEGLTGLNVIMSQDLIRDYDGVPSNSLFRSENTFFLLLGQILNALPIRATHIEPIDRIARTVSESA
ncbi:MAG: hypothetical protein HY610_03575, partial [Elusimicrobia bacterium]|nr:hypothetical protein [Elusimicrobiota bacterium]